MRIGLTGGIGSGKSTVAALLKQRGATIVDADRIAREVVEPGQPALEALAAEFGQDIIAEDGTLQRDVLAQRAFATEEATAKLNAITHPAIAERISECLDAATSEVVVLDHPLLLETDYDYPVDTVWVVDVPAAERVRRLVEYRGLEAEDAKARIARQMSDEQRRAHADVLVDNAGDRASLERRVAQLWDQLTAVG